LLSYQVRGERNYTQLIVFFIQSCEMKVAGGRFDLVLVSGIGIW
jgi:hypothetical protein